MPGPRDVEGVPRGLGAGRGVGGGEGMHGVCNETEDVLAEDEDPVTEAGPSRGRAQSRVERRGAPARP